MLSKREIEVELLALRGLSGKQIAEELGIKLSTVKMHLAAVYQKRGVQNRLQLLIMNMPNKNPPAVYVGLPVGASNG